MKGERDAMTKTPSILEIEAAQATTPRVATVKPRTLPAAQGLYDPAREHDACGVGFIAHMNESEVPLDRREGLKILHNLEHRGAVGADPLMGDGAGMLVQIPHTFFKAEMAAQGVELPEAGQYGVGFVFMPKEEERRLHFKDLFEQAVQEEGCVVLGCAKCRSTIPRCPRRPISAATEPAIARSSSAAPPRRRRTTSSSASSTSSAGRLEPRLCRGAVGRHRLLRCVAVLAHRVYKGMFLSYQVGAYYRDLKDERFESALALVHHASPPTRSRPGGLLTRIGWSRTMARSTRCAATSTGWPRARPRWIPSSSATTFQALADLLRGQSDTACFDNALELLTQGGYTLAHAMMS